MRRTVGIGRIAGGHRAVIVHPATGDQTTLRQRQRFSSGCRFGATFTVCHRHRQTRTLHAGKEQRRTLLDQHQAQTAFKLLGGVADKAREMFCTGDHVFQLRHHLATVADTEREGFIAGKERRKFVTRTLVEQHVLGPATAGTEHVAIRETAAGHDTGKIFQGHTAGENVAHVHVEAAEAGTHERCRHFQLTVDALLTQDRHFRLQTFGDIGRGDIVGDVKRQLRRQPRIVFVALGGVFLVSALRVVAQLLHFVRQARPDFFQRQCRLIQQRVAACSDQDATRRHRFTEVMQRIGQALRCKRGTHARNIGSTHLHDSAELFIEQCGGDVAAERSNIDLDTAVTGKRHFGKRCQQTTIGTIVIGQQSVVGIQ